MIEGQEKKKPSRDSKDLHLDDELVLGSAQPTGARLEDSGLSLEEHLNLGVDDNSTQSEKEESKTDSEPKRPEDRPLVEYD